ncbi:uncharacterized protein LOC143291689 [Babylonia areolata]|uniref:uncharacterized protein LOC143291689 n=1 Tax=Babylonia areolata TaxID=304850 RepID=UPI003FD0DE71
MAAPVFSKTTKLMLKNVIRHTNSHNKTVEESEMWQQYDRMKELGGLDPSNPSYGHDDRCSGRNRDRRRNDYWNSRSEKRAYLSTSCRSRQAHMDEEEEKGKGGNSTSTYWMRQLEKLETSDPNRWDHSGYRELYPDDFRSSSSDSEDSRLVSHHKKKDRAKKKKKHRSKSKKRRQKKKSSHRHRHQARRRRPSSSSDSSESDSDSESFSSVCPRQRRQHISRRHHFEQTKSRECAAREKRFNKSTTTSSSDSSSSSYSDSDRDSDSRGQSHRGKGRKRTHESVSKGAHYSKTESYKYVSSGSSRSGYDSDSRRHAQSHRLKHRKRTCDSSEPTASSDDFVSSPERKKVKTSKSGCTKRTKTKNSKLERQNERNTGHSKHGDTEKEENDLVVMWKEVNGHGGPSNSKFDRHLQKEISTQYRSLKRQYVQKHKDTEVNGNSWHKLKKRRYSSSYSSDSD